MRNNLIWRAVAEIFRQFTTSQQGVYEHEGRTVSFEKTIFHAGKFRLIIIAEEIIEDLQILIDQALENENYELAEELRKKLEQQKIGRASCRERV